MRYNNDQRYRGSEPKRPFLFVEFMRNICAPNVYIEEKNTIFQIFYSFLTVNPSIFLYNPNKSPKL